jgi:hypothetical protein
MTTFSRTTIDCDFWNCSARSDYSVLGAAEARKKATAAGWKRWADMDLCPVPTPSGWYPIESHRPRNHADFLTGEHEPTLVRMPPAYNWSKTPQWRVTCACGWDGNAEDPQHSRKFAAQDWTRHVAEAMKAGADD